MAWLKSHNDQVDPFNAGEPTLPWEDPEPLHEDDDCKLTGESYDGPTKTRDNYDAPSSDDPSVREIVGELFSTEGKPASKRVRPRSESRRSRKPSATPASAKKPAARRIIKWVVVGVVLVNLMPLLVGALSLVVDDVIPNLFGSDEETNEYPLAGHESPDFPDVGPNSLPDVSEDELEEKAIADFTATRLDTEKSSGSNTHKLVAQTLDNDLSEELGYSAQELGIDTAAYADWLLSKFSYTIDSVYAFDDGTGSLYFNGIAPSHYTIMWDATESLSRYLDGEGLLEAQGPRTLTAEQQQTAQELFDSALERAEASESFASLDFENVNGSWTMDEEEFSEEMAFVLGLA